MPEGAAFLLFERAKFRTRLPQGRLYTAGHMWLREAGEGVWQVGLTRFALRMLGEPVEMDFEVDQDDVVEKGQVLGWLEGFKAVTDLYSPLTGRFAGGNPELEDGLDAVHRAPYARGWLFALSGDPGEDCVDTEGYASFLEATIDKMLGEEES
jgi:glycine cleavage system H protein